ncbi:MAG TPA: hypothetical protein VM056_00720 [Terriglobales bacterium]|nr:hypothetical protein [Terriglobales bacterium]
MSSKEVKASLVLVLLCALSAFANAQQWTPLGPDGGDVRSIARDPHASNRLFLGTSSGQVYESANGGQTWARFVRLGESRDLVLDHIVFHPTRAGVIYIAAWSVEEHTGDLFRSVDNGRTWKPLREMRGKSIRAFDLSPSNPEILVAGALDGVYRSMDGGEKWSFISPPNHKDIRNIESVAVDPKNPEIIYAGTWHLPWKTTDGGLTWTNIKQGIIDDSDVFSIIIDLVNPSVVYASACSGIYKSESAGLSFRKVQGIPFSARRTRVLKQDPVNRDIVYAGTTEGLWKTLDAGVTWKRISESNLIINDILIDPADTQKVLLATDRSGLLASVNGGENLRASNRGFSHRQVTSVLMDKDDSLKIYAGVINDKEFGGVFVSRDSGSSWEQMSKGLNGNDIFTLQQSPKGTLVAGTNRGLFTADMSVLAPTWTLRDNVSNMVEVALKTTAKKKQVARKAVRSQLTSRVNDVQLADDAWFAATSSGVFTSTDEGRTWQGGPIQKMVEFISVKASSEVVVAATRRAVVISLDRGTTWKSAPIPDEVSLIANVAVDPESRIYLAAREGAYRSADSGLSWQRLTRLPVNQLTSIQYDAENKRLLTSSVNSTHLFQSTDGGTTWKRADTGWLVRGMRSSRGRMLGVTAFDGVVAQPDSVTKPLTPSISLGSGGGARD